jgi:hypothetical protein
MGITYNILILATIPLQGIAQGSQPIIGYRASLETPVEFPEMPRRKLLILYYITNYTNAIFSIG